MLPLLPQAVVATASFAGLRESELCGLEWRDYSNASLTVRRSGWRTVISPPKTRASREAVPVITALAKILDGYRASMHNPQTGVMFHQGGGERMDMDKLAQRVLEAMRRMQVVVGVAGVAASSWPAAELKGTW